MLALILQVLSQYNRSSKNSQSRNSILSDCGTTSSDYTLSNNIPSEIFQNKPFEEHISESYHRLREGKKTSGLHRKSSEGGNYKDTWGFVLQDLEKKGYNKDVGNRGDILHHLSGSKPSNSNVPTNISAGLTPDKTSKQGLNSQGELLPELIPSTVQLAANETDSSSKKIFNIADAMKQLNLNDAAAAASPRKPVLSPSSSATLHKDINACEEKYNWSGKFGSDRESSSLKHNSVYDNLSYGGFETAHQDTDDETEADKPKKPSKSDFASHSSAASSGSRYMNPSGPDSLSGTKTNKKSSSSNKDSKKFLKDTVDVPWSCVSCTFMNETHPSVCEMCSRSRQTPDTVPIKPLETGGLQCSQCTLINDKGSESCSACGIALTACGTYI